MADDDNTGGVPDLTTMLGEYAEHPEIKGKISDDLPSAVQTLAKRVVDGSAEISRRLRVPSADAGPEDRSAFLDRLKEAVPNLVAIPDKDDEAGWKRLHAQLGAPEEPGGYKSEGVPEDIIEALAPTAHAYGLTKEQFKALAAKLDGMRNATADEIAQQSAETTAALKRDWGDAYSDKMMYARLFASHKGLEQIMETNPRYAHNKELLQVFAELGAELAENEQISTPMAVASGMLTVEEAIARRSEILANSDHPYNNQFSDGHNKAIQEMLKLNEYISRMKGRG